MRAYDEIKLKLLREKARRKSQPINTYKPDSTPERNQLAFHQSNSRYRLAFGGNRAGKSVVTAYETAAWARGCHRFQTIPAGPKEIYVVSAEYRTIYNGIYRHIRSDGTGKAMQFLDKSWIKATAAKVPGATVPLPAWIQVWCTHYDDGQPVRPEDNRERPFSTIWFISGDGGEQARKKLQAAAVDLVIIDEEIEELLFQELQMRTLDSNGRICISATLVRSEDWLMNLEDKANEGDPTITLIRLDTESSPHISEQAKKDIFGSLSSEEYQVRVKGKSRRQFGLIYPEFDMSHVFDKNKEFPDGFPAEWPIITGFDPGFRVFAGLWCAVDVSNSTLWFFRELYEKGAILEEVCRLASELEGYDLEPVANTPIYKRIPVSPKPETPAIRLIDPAGLRKLEDGSLSIGQQMTSYFDMPVAPANNDIHSGIEACRKFLGVNGLTGKPYARFDQSLTNFFSERRRYRLRTDTSGRNAHATKAEPVRKNNHLMDVFRYISTWALYLLGENIPVTTRSRFTENTVGASLKMADRLEEHARALREEHARTNSFVGSEW